MLILTILRGPDQGRRFELPDDEPQLIGRSSEALPLTDQTISRRHAEMTPDDGRWYIRDLESSNGTYVNGQRVTARRMLQPGDQVRTGNTVIVFGKDPTPKRKHGVRVAKGDEMEVSVERTAISADDSMIMAIPEPMEAAAVQLRVIYELTQLIGSVVDREHLLEKVMDVVFEHFQADRGFILLQESPDERPEPVVVRYRVPPRNDEDRHIVVSRTIVQHVMRHGEGVLSSNAMTDRRFATGDSVHRLGIRSTLCVPIKFKDRLFGVIHLDSKIANYTYTDDQLLLLTAMGVQTGLALANADQYHQRVSRERLAAVGEAVASLSHSIKNIIQGLRGGADVVELGLKKKNMQTVEAGWAIALRNIERIYALTTNMLAFSTQRRPEIELTSLNKLLEEVIELEQSQYDAKMVAIIEDFDENMPPVPIDPGGIHQAVLNLLNNALEAVEPETGAVSVSTRYLAEQEQVAIKVADNGCGIDTARLKALWLPFRSTKGYGGTGLGLVVTKKVVEEHGGRITVESQVGQGSTFTILLPTNVAAIPGSADTAAGAMARDPDSSIGLTLPPSTPAPPAKRS
jgi:two-component system, NtrC family, sensor kinase